MQMQRLLALRRSFRSHNKLLLADGRARQRPAAVAAAKLCACPTSILPQGVLPAITANYFLVLAGRQELVQGHAAVIL
jgi:hypothetical protein